MGRVLVFCCAPRTVVAAATPAAAVKNSRLVTCPPIAYQHTLTRSASAIARSLNNWIVMPIDSELITFAHKLADTAGEVIRPYFRQRIEVTDKGLAKGKMFDPVTAADQNAEKAIRAIIESERPNDGIIGEEFGEKPSANGLAWLLDPVDGTRAFITGRHEWASLIGLEENGRAVLGIIDQPVLGERFIGVNGETELLTQGGRTPLRVRPCADLSEAVLCATHPSAYFTSGEREAFRRVESAVRMSRFGGDCYIF